MHRSRLGENRPDYVFICGVCGRKIEGKSNTIHLGIGRHVGKESRLGLRQEPYTSPAKYGDVGHKFA